MLLKSFNKSCNYKWSFVYYQLSLECRDFEAANQTWDGCIHWKTSPIREQ